MSELGDVVDKQSIMAASILIVDDNPANVRLLNEILEDEGYANIKSVTDPREVVGIVGADRFDLLLLDINMPHLDGFQVMEQLRDVKGAEHLPVLVLTAQNDQGFRLRALEMGAMDFVTKPFDVSEVLNRIHNILMARILYRQTLSQTEVLEGLSSKLSKYLSPQVYQTIFSGKSDVSLITERKKLTIFFSDIKDFTQTTEDLQPEDLTYLLNSYFTEMSKIALEHGATIDKFIGDAMLMFFGDPESKGVKEDAQACLRMAIAMQRKMAELGDLWRAKGYEKPFQMRIGINTGFCNVGNFGSVDRMDYTIIGGEVNLTARLETRADPGGILMSYETYALVEDIVRAESRAPIHVKGIRREIRPYAVTGLYEDLEKKFTVIRKERKGLNLLIDFEAMDDEARQATVEDLQEALTAVQSGFA